MIKIIGITKNAIEILVKHYKDCDFFLKNTYLDNEGTQHYVLEINEKEVNVYIQYEQVPPLFGKVIITQ